MRRIVSTLLRKSGVLGAALFVRRVPRIVMYHRLQERPGGLFPCVDLFEEQVRHLSGCYRVLSLGQLHESLVSGTVPDNAVVLTIDDGYEDSYRLAFPVLQKYGVPATLYVTTDFLDGRMWFWWDAVTFILNRTPRTALTFAAGGVNRTFKLEQEHERRAAWSAIGTVCLTLCVAERERLLAALADDLHVSVPEAPPPEFRAITSQQVREMAANGIEIGSHTCSHLRLSLASEAELAHEVVDSKRRLEHLLGTPVRSFCYPFGRQEDLNDTVRRAVVDAGYRTAVVAYHDSRVTDDLFALRRLGADSEMKEFRRIVRRNGDVFDRLRRRVTRNAGA